MDEKHRQSQSSSEPSNSKNKTKHQKSSPSGITRKRVSQACDRCRARKDKCDGLRPVCSTCAALEQVCSYDPATKKRGLPEGYVRAVEKLWGLTIREADGIEDKILTILNGGPDCGDFEELVSLWNDRTGSETLLETWRKSRISQELERLIPFLEIGEEKLGKRKRPEIGPFREESITNMNQIFPHPLEMSPRPPEKEGFHWNQQESTADFLNPKRIQVGLPSVLSGPNLVYPTTLSELPSHCWILLDIFFSYTHCWLPIMEKHDLLRTSYQHSQCGLNVDESSYKSAEHAALWAVLAYADHQHTAFKGSEAIKESKWTSDMMYAKSKTMIPNEDGKFELGHVQSLIILALIDMGKDLWDQAWLLIGQAARICILLDLNAGPKSRTGQTGSSDRQSRKKHTFLGCFVMDTIIAARLNRRPQLRTKDADQVGPVEEDGPDEWNHWMDSLGIRTSSEDLRGPAAILSTFNQMVSVVKILNLLTCDEANSSSGSVSGSDIVKYLDSYRQNLPFLENSAARERLLPHQFHLRLLLRAITLAVWKNAVSLKSVAQSMEITIGGILVNATQVMLSLLGQQSNELSLLLMPPTCDYMTRIAFKTAENLQDIDPNVPFSQKDWQDGMQKLVAVMAKVWPTFRQPQFSSFLATSKQEILPAVPNPSLRKLSDITIRRNTHPQQPSIDENLLNANETLDTRPKMFSDSSGMAPRPDFNSALGFNASRSLEAFIGDGVSHSDLNSSQANLPAQASVDQLQYLGGSLGSEIDGDSMFNDFAALDAMEWNNNLDESLMNLGFENPDHMTQDFYAVCEIADPLYTSALVQQLVSSNSSTNLGNLGIQPAAGTDSSGAGLLPTPYDSNHLEASHILQAFSSSHKTG